MASSIDESPRSEDGFFNDDYIYFSRSLFPPERNIHDARNIWRFLKLQPGMKVLDIGCGYGRITLELAKLGADMTGLDEASHLLEQGREDASSAKMNIKYVKGDMRDLPWHNTFDAVIMWYTTFGIFDDEEENEKVVFQATKAIRARGQMLIEQQNRLALV